MAITNPEIPNFIDSITKRVYPLTDKEKNCIDKLGKLYIKRGHLKKAIIETITKHQEYDSSSSQSEQKKY